MFEYAIVGKTLKMRFCDISTGKKMIVEFPELTSYLKESWLEFKKLKGTNLRFGYHFQPDILVPKKAYRSVCFRVINKNLEITYGTLEDEEFRNKSCTSKFSENMFDKLVDDIISMY